MALVSERVLTWHSGKLCIRQLSKNALCRKLVAGSLANYSNDGFAGEIEKRFLANDNKVAVKPNGDMIVLNELDGNGKVLLWLDQFEGNDNLCIEQPLTTDQIRKKATTKRKHMLNENYAESMTTFDNEPSLMRRREHLEQSSSLSPPKRRKRTPWSEMETNLLDVALDEVTADEQNRWAEIKRRYFAHSPRTNVDIKDRFKYVCRQRSNTK